MGPLNRRRFLATGAAAAAGVLALGTRPAAARPAPPVEVAPLGPDFLWGVASSGFQSEGRAPDSNWTRYIAAGKTEDPYLESVDFYSRYRSDVALAVELGGGSTGSGSNGPGYSRVRISGTRTVSASMTTS